MDVRAYPQVLTLRSMEAETYRLVRDAILQRKQVLGFYRVASIVLCPHRLGWRQGEATALCYELLDRQDGNPVREPLGSPRLWRLILIAELRSATLRSGFWVSIPRYLRPALPYFAVDVELE